MDAAAAAAAAAFAGVKTGGYWQCCCYQAAAWRRRCECGAAGVCSGHRRLLALQRMLRACPSGQHVWHAGRLAEQLIELRSVQFGGLLIDRAHDIFVNRAAEGIEPGPVLGDGLLLISGKKHSQRPANTSLTDVAIL